MIGLVLISFLLASSAAAAERPADFAYGMAIGTDGQHGLYEIDIPAAVYRAVTRADLGDVRIFNGQGEVVPHALRSRVAIRKQAGVAVKLPLFPLWGEGGNKVDDLNLHIEKRRDGMIVDVQSRAKSGAEKKLRGYLLDASGLQQPLTTLEFDWQSRAGDFIGTVRIEGSDDLSNWNVLADNAALARLSFEGHQVKRSRVEVRAAKAKYLRISWPENQAPLEALAVVAESSPTVIASPRLWQSFTASAAAGTAGEYNYDLGGAIKFDRLRVQLPQVNTLVQVQVFSRAKSSDEWRSVTSALAYRLRQRDAEINSPEIIVTSQGERYWLLRVDQKGGGVGSGALTMEIGWVPHKLVFAARGAGPFQLAYGSARVKPAGLAIESLIPGYQTTSEFKVARATLGAPATLAGASRLSASRDYKTLALWGSLIFGVTLLGWMALRLSRQVANPAAESSTTENSH